MIESISSSIADKIKAADPNSTVSSEVLAYALGVYLNFITGAGLTLLIGWATGKFTLTLLAFMAFCIIRFFSGGFHFKSLTLCALVSAGLISLIPHIDVTRTYVLLLTVLMMIIFGIFSPNMDRETTTLDQKYYPAMKIVSVLLVSSNLIFQSDVLALTILLQGILIIPWIFMRGGELTK